MNARQDRTWRLPFRAIALLLGGALLLLFVAACGADPTPTPTPTPRPTATPPPVGVTPVPTPTPDPAVLFQAEWDELIAAAKEDGEVVIAAGGSPSRTYRPIIKVFGDMFGLKMTMSTGSGTDTVNRVLAERTAGRYTTDVSLVSLQSSVLRLVPAGALTPLAPLFVHPEVLDTSLWYGNQHWYGDEENRFSFIYSSRVKPVHCVWVNTNKISEEEIAAFKVPLDFLAAKYSGTIAAETLDQASGMRLLIDMYYEPDMGPEFVDAFIRDAVFTTDSRVRESWLVEGRYPIRFTTGCGGRILTALETAGLPIKEVGIAMERPRLAATGSGCCIQIYDKAPRSNAAKLFLNWWLSKEGQTAYHEAIPDPTESQSLREDIPTGRIFPRAVRTPGVTYYFPDAEGGDFAERTRIATEFVDGIALREGKR